MTTHKIPVLVSRYADGIYTALVVDGPETDAVGQTPSEAFDQVKQHLKKQAEREPEQYWPRIESYELCRTSVEVRLFYRDGKRQFPASREMMVPVRFILGHYADKSLECFLPDYEVVFHCPAKRELHDMIREAVRGAASQLTSRGLVSATPPDETELRFVRVRLAQKDYRDESSSHRALSLVADPVIKRKRRGKRRMTLYREKETSSLIEAMADASTLLVGDAGCGKTSVARAAAQIHENGLRDIAKAAGTPTPPPIVWSSSAENLIAGMQYLGEWEARLEAVIAELDSIGGYLLISSLVDLIRLGGSQPTDSLAAFLMPYIQRRELKLIVECTPDEIEAARRLLPGLVECFQIIRVDPLSPQQTNAITSRILQDAERNAKFKVEPTAAETASRLFAQFMPYQAPPRDVVEMVEGLIDVKTQRGEQEITPRDMVHQFTKLTGLPDELLLDSMTLQSEQVEEFLSAQVIGQPHAVRAAVNVVLRLKAGLCDPARPVSTMLFCGPTGVGKTQLARSLAEYLFGASESREQKLIRLDMSEYANWDAVERLMIGPDGEIATWISRLRSKPMSVVLLDEFEKSSPEVHDCLLSALDEGRLTDRFGRTTTLCGAVVILTSNVGSKSTSGVGFVADDASAIDRAIQQEFRPEFLNRLDEVVRFEPLPKEIIQQILEKELRELSKRETLRSGGVYLKWDEAVVQRLASIGFDPLLGARPLQRAIEREIVAKIARQMLNHTGGSLTIDLAQLVSGDLVQN